MPRQYREWTDGTRTPVNPDCGIEGCERAEYRQGLCREHHAMIPFEVKMRRANEMMMELHEKGKQNAIESVAMVQAMIDV